MKKGLKEKNPTYIFLICAKTSFQRKKQILFSYLDFVLSFIRKCASF